MQRKAVNPWDWSLNLGYNQGELIEGARRQLICAGQTSVDANGAPQHPGDMRGQVSLALDNLGAVLRGAGMSEANLISLRIYAVDMGALMGALDILGQRLGPVQVRPPTTVLGVSALALPGLMVEIEAVAAE